MSRSLDATRFLALSLLWGLSFPAISVGLKYLPPLFFASVRYDVAALVLLSVAAIRIDDWVPSRRHDLAAIAAGGLFLIGANGLLFVAQQSVPSGLAAIIQSLSPIVTALLAIALLDERLTAVGGVGVLIGFLGVASSSRRIRMPSSQVRRPRSSSSSFRCVASRWAASSSSDSRRRSIAFR